MDTFNSLLTALADSFFSLWRGAPAWVALVLVSILAGLVATVVFRFTSRQDRLRRDAELIQSQLLAMKLFRDDLGTMGASLGRLLYYSGVRVWHSLPPLLVMTVPFVLLLVQMARWYEHAPLVVGDRAIVVLRLSEKAWSSSNVVAPEDGVGFTIETPPLRDPEEHAVYCRIRINEPRATTLHWNLPRQKAEKTLAVAADRAQLAPVDATKPGPGRIHRLLHPGERGFKSADDIQEISIEYPRRSTPVLGLDLPWWATFFVVSVLAAVVGGRFLKVQY
jgi:hypothetical protein